MEKKIEDAKLIVSVALKQPKNANRNHRILLELKDCLSSIQLLYYFQLVVNIVDTFF